MRIVPEHPAAAAVMLFAVAAAAACFAVIRPADHRHRPVPHAVTTARAPTRS